MVFNKLKYFIISFSIYEEEPLSIIITSILMSKISSDYTKIIEAILELFNEGFIEIFYYGKKYNKLLSIHKHDLEKYITENIKTGFTILEHDYYLQSTDKSYQFLKKEDRPIDLTKKVDTKEC